jgi:hypothetical protein
LQTLTVEPTREAIQDQLRQHCPFDKAQQNLTVTELLEATPVLCDSLRGLLVEGLLRREIWPEGTLAALA